MDPQSDHQFSHLGRHRYAVFGSPEPGILCGVRPVRRQRSAGRLPRQKTADHQRLWREAGQCGGSFLLFRDAHPAAAGAAAASAGMDLVFGGSGAVYSPQFLSGGRHPAAPVRCPALHPQQTHRRLPVRHRPCPAAAGSGSDHLLPAGVWHLLHLKYPGADPPHQSPTQAHGKLNSKQNALLSQRKAGRFSQRPIYAGVGDRVPLPRRPIPRRNHFEPGNCIV